MNISTAQARGEFSEMINRVAFGKERVVITRRGKDLAAIIPIEDYTLLGALEDKIDLLDAKTALSEAKTKKGKSWNVIKSK